eukprot:2472195-Prymnesium_polylepis.1
MSHVGTLPVGEPSQYAGPNPRFDQPKEVACFSRDASRKIHLDRRALRAYTAPALPVALDVGFDEYVPKDNEDDPAPLGDVVAALAARQQAPQPGQFVTFRNNLNKLFGTPYSLGEDWEMGVEPQPDGVIQLQVRDTERKKREEANRDERGKRMCYWGYRFEQVCTGGAGKAAASGGSAVGGGTAANGGYRVPSPSDPESYAHMYEAHELAELRQRYAKYAQVAAPTAPAQGGGGGVVNANEEFCC